MFINLKAGFSGSTCQFSNPCANNPCLNGGTCNAVGNTGAYTCKCANRFTGSNCQYGKS